MNLPNSDSPSKRGVKILGTGLTLPNHLLTNDELSKTIDTNDAWIQQRTGIRQRYVVQNGQTVRDLAVGAVSQALENAGLEPKDLDFLICCTMTPEMVCPNTGARIVADLGAVPAGAMDLSAACSGFVFGLNIGHDLIKSGSYKNIAVVGAETLSEMVNWKDRRTCVLFGDGAGAVILSATDQTQCGCVYQAMHSNGNGWKDLFVPRREYQLPDENALFNGSLDTLQMNGREVYKFAVSTFKATVDQALKACNLKADDLAMIVAHQSNARILESAREKLGLPKEKLYINIDRFANTSAASVPLCLHELNEAGRIKTGDLVLFIGMGGGLTWGSNLWRW